MRDVLHHCFDLAAGYDHAAAGRAAAKLARLAPAAPTASAAASAASIRSRTPTSLSTGTSIGTASPDPTIAVLALAAPLIHSLSQWLANLFKLEDMYARMILSRPRRMFGRETLDGAYRLFRADVERDRHLFEDLDHHAALSLVGPLNLERTYSFRSLSSQASHTQQLDVHFLAHICIPLIHLANTRATMIRIWKQLGHCSDPASILAVLPAAEELVAKTDLGLLCSLSPNFAAMVKCVFFSPSSNPLHSHPHPSTSRELQVLTSLLRTERGIAHHFLPDALSHLYQAQTILTEWKALIAAAEPRAAKAFRLGNVAVPPHVEFWSDLTKHYMAKMNLHFFRGAVQPGQKLGLGLVETIDDFIKMHRPDTSFHLLLHVPPRAAHAIDPSGYTFPDRHSHFGGGPQAARLHSPPSPTSTSSSSRATAHAEYAALSSHPADLAPADWTNIVAILQLLARAVGDAAGGQDAAPSPAPSRSLAVGELLPYVDNKVGRSFYIARVAEPLYAVVVLAERRPRDPAVIGFLTEVQDALWGRPVLGRILKEK
ncbi:hypothetical protein AMAG_13835 [Allomyces macrogynus ATCC 38327]|uniref:Uncharacterized protein n=1 Tax=Allomyces macrogynus (strain ATCC 38327) TaxID=578462 RepID=A0A0L0T313_ALLM3|nr:hypothetical protein AMAG_13835 [Allomyces macrogynus ATCC 38327]|eukprot:KNE68959.1 hypothetical protein AMAG_13835 [Allomyces macrogynus ATCC 38327]